MVNLDSKFKIAGRPVSLSHILVGAAMVTAGFWILKSMKQKPDPDDFQ